jgi:mRNA interferase HigB
MGILYILLMRIIAKSVLLKFCKQKKYKAAEQALFAWHDEVKAGLWKNFNQLRQDFPKASVVGNDRVVFDINGGAFRLIVKFEFRINAVYIRFFGTHKEYEAVSAEKV